MEYADVRDQLMKELQLKALEIRGELSPELEEDWKMYQQMNPEVKAPGPEFVQYMRDMMANQSKQAEDQYSAPPVKAGPKWPGWGGIIPRIFGEKNK